MMVRFLKNFLMFVGVYMSVYIGVFAVSNNDLLRKATQDTRTYETTIDKEAKDVFDDSYGIDIDLGNIGTDKKVINAGMKDSLLVKITRFMLKITILFAVPMVIYSGIKIILSLGDEGQLKKTLIDLIYVAGGVVLALLAVMIIYIATSLTRNSLGII